MTKTRQPKKEWTVLVYLAADNNLNYYGPKNLNEIKRAGSTRSVNFIAQMDPAGDGPSYRYFLQPSAKTSLGEDIVEKSIELNCGDYQTLRNFIEWGIVCYPAKHYLLIIWGHGSGWDDNDQCLRQKAAQHREAADRANDSLPGWFPAMDLTTVLGTDDNSGNRLAPFDYLTNKELKRALAEALGQTGRAGRKLDILGMDACLMSMAEVGYQVRNSISYLVSSEEIEPSQGWPYEAICRRLIRKPKMKPRELASLIVDLFVESYQATRKTVTLSACNLGKAEELAQAVKALAATLTKNITDVEVLAAIAWARREFDSAADASLNRNKSGKAKPSRALAFFIKDYVDLYDFASLLQTTCRNLQVQAAVQQVLKVLGGFVAHSGSTGETMDKARGLSIYFPSIAHCYNELDFCRKTGWDDFLLAYLTEALRPSRSNSRRRQRGRLARNGNSANKESSQLESDILPPAEVVNLPDPPGAG